MLKNLAVKNVEAEKRVRELGVNWRPISEQYMDKLFSYFSSDTKVGNICFCFTRLDEDGYKI